MKPAGAILAAAAALVTLASPAAALDPKRRPTQYMHDAWTELDGLPQNSVRAIAKTRDGFLWLGTEEGLVRFDGARFRLFDRKTTTGRAGNEITDLATTTDGVLHVLTRKDGLCRFEEPAFTCAPLPDHAEGAVLLAADNDVMIATDKGVFTALEGAAPRRVGAVGAGPTRSVARAGGSLWVATADGGLLEGDGHDVVPVPLPPELSMTDIYTVAPSRRGVVVGTSRGVYFVVDHKLTPAPGKNRPTGRVRFAREDPDGNLFVSIDDDAIYRLADDRWARVPLSPTQPVERANAFLADDEGNVWIGSLLSGIHRLRNGAFVPWGKPEGIDEGYVNATLATKEGVIWLGGPGGVYGIMGDDVVHIGVKEGLPSDSVRGMSLAKDGSVYVGTHSGVAKIVSWKPPRAERVAAAGDLDVNAIDDSGDALVLGTRDGLVDLATKRTYGRADGLPSTWVAELHHGPDGTLWIATDQGLARRRVGSDRIQHVFADVLGRTMITSFFDAADGAILVGTSDMGLARIKGDDIRLLRTGAGLHDETTFVVIDDQTGSLWMTCNKGIARVPRAEVDAFFDDKLARIAPRLFGRGDGMRSRECNGGTPAGTRDGAGRLWFPTMLGAVMIDPRALDDGPPPRTPIVDRARSGDVEIAHPSRMVLAPSRTVDVTFAVPALTGADRVTLETRLDGEPWRAIVGRTATYASLGPGIHHLDVRAIDVIGRASASSSTLVLDVTPRLAETTWFRIVLGAGAAFLVLAMGWLRLRAVESRRRRLAELVEERTRELAKRNADLAAALAELGRAQTDLVRAEKMASVAALVSGIAHELNNPLAFLTGNLGPLRKYAEFLVRAIREVGAGETSVADVRLGARKDLAFVEKDLAKLLADMDEGGRRARLIVGDLQNLTSARTRAIEPVELGRVVEQAIRLLSAKTKKGITIETELAPSESVLARAGELEQAVVNLIDNAIRAVGVNGGGTIRVRVFEEDGARIVVVEDDGPGMTADVKARAMEPFFTTRAAGEGSGLGLAIVAQIAEHHGGSLAIDSAPDHGTRMRLTVRNATAASE